MSHCGSRTSSGDDGCACSSLETAGRRGGRCEMGEVEEDVGWGR